jgi:hypothetical protein
MEATTTSWIDVLAGQPSQATMMQSIRMWKRAQRRQRMVRDLEQFLGIQCGGWPLKRRPSSDLSSNERKSAEARDASASN